MYSNWAKLSEPEENFRDENQPQLQLKLKSAPRSKHSPVTVIKTSQLMLYRETIVICSQIHTKHTSTPCGQNLEFFNVKLAVQIMTTGL